jgi:FtsZ-interacting cell division protein YlmF
VQWPPTSQSHQQITPHLLQAVKRNQTVVVNASSADAGEAQRIDADTFLFTPAQARVEQWPLAVSPGTPRPPQRQVQSAGPAR